MYLVGESMLPCGVPECSGIGGPMYVFSFMDTVRSTRKLHRRRVKGVVRLRCSSLYMRPGCQTLSKALATSRSIMLVCLCVAKFCATSSWAKAMACSVPLCGLNPYCRVLCVSLSSM